MGYSSFHLYNVEWTTRWNWIRVESWTDTCTPAIKTSAKVICERLGDRRSPKIIRVVRALTRTRSLRNCEIVVRNIAATIYHEILSWILHDRNSMHLSNPGWQNIGTVPTSGRSDEFGHQTFDPPSSNEKQTFLLRKIRENVQERTSIFSPLVTLTSFSHELGWRFLGIVPILSTPCPLWQLGVAR